MFFAILISRKEQKRSDTMSSFNVLGLKVTILLLIILVTFIIIGGLISLCYFLI